MIKKSLIDKDGLGCFAEKNIKKGTMIFAEEVLYIPMGFSDVWMKSGLWKYTVIDRDCPNYFVYLTGQARYINNSYNDFNCRISFGGGMIHIMAMQNIKAGKELFCDYRDH